MADTESDILAEQPGDSLRVRGAATLPDLLNQCSAPRRIPVDDVTKVLAIANALQERELRLSAESELDSLGLPETDDGCYDVEIVYKVAEKIGETERRFVDQALDSLYIPVRVQFKDLTEVDANPGLSVVGDIYHMCLLKVLQEAYPEDCFRVVKRNIGSSYSLNFYEVSTERVPRSAFMATIACCFGGNTFKTVENSKLLADILIVETNNYTLKCRLEDPKFIRACGEGLRVLNRYFDQCVTAKNPVHDYHPLFQ